jgi:hypothetical protein
MNTGQEARDTKNMGKDAHATDPAQRDTNKYTTYTYIVLVSNNNIA